jgi:hypothetical protein
MLDLDITQDNRLSKSAKFFYLYLIGKYGQEGQCRVPYPVFAKEFGVTRAAISFWVSSLEEAGYIKTFYFYERKKYPKNRKTFERVGKVKTITFNRKVKE